MAPEDMGVLKFLCERVNLRTRHNGDGVEIGHSKDHRRVGVGDPFKAPTTPASPHQGLLIDQPPLQLGKEEALLDGGMSGGVLLSLTVYVRPPLLSGAHGVCLHDRWPHDVHAMPRWCGPADGVRAASLQVGAAVKEDCDFNKDGDGPRVGDWRRRGCDESKRWTGDVR